MIEGLDPESQAYQDRGRMHWDPREVVKEDQGTTRDSGKGNRSPLSNKPRRDMAGENKQVGKSNEQRVFDYFSANPNATGKEAAAALGMVESTVSKHRNSLRKDNLIA
ncbi:hypothetical protein [Rhodococcus opacus]|uniref:hypothetical protein n=1 Tax=Rhodococcus opacus TaxID=37919 RepID=UPI0022356570|nr:hypothetical protein [Rhodococcus opacus]UZG58010.1 hypothetical protein ONE62_12190 [Rhodococcus opacus]